MRKRDDGRYGPRWFVYDLDTDVNSSLEAGCACVVAGKKGECASKMKFSRVQDRVDPI